MIYFQARSASRGEKSEPFVFIGKFQELGDGMPKQEIITDQGTCGERE